MDSRKRIRRLWWTLPLLAMAAIGWKLAADAGIFRDLVERRPGPCQVVEGVFGPEDIEFDPDTGWAYVSSQDRAVAAAGDPVPGAIQRYRPGAPETLVNLTPDASIDFRPHGLSLIRDPGGQRRLFVVNHPGGNLFDRRDDWPDGQPRHTIEIFDIADDRLRRVASHRDPLIRTPNDIAAVDLERYYFTNDHGSADGWLRKLEDVLRRPWADVIHFDGRQHLVAAEGLNYANGIALSRDRTRLFVAETTNRRIREYDRDTTHGTLTERRTIRVGFGVDNLSIDPEDQSLWLAGHLNLLAFLGHARDRQQPSPSVVAQRSPGHETETEIRFMNDGTLLSGASVAVRAGDYLLIGSVFEKHLLECRLDPLRLRTD